MNIIANYSIISLKKNFTYKTNFIFLILDELVDCGAVFLFWSSLYELGLHVEGWGAKSRFVFIGLNLISSAVSNLFVGAQDLQERILDGSLDLDIVKPAPTWALVTFERCNFLRFILTFPLGLFIAAYGVESFRQFPIFLGAVLASIMASLTLELIRASIFVLSFWLKRVSILVQLLQMIFSLKRYPTSSYTGAFFRFLMMVMPIAYVASIPTQWLHTGEGLGKIWLLILSFLTTILLLFVLWHRGRKYYESAN